MIRIITLQGPLLSDENGNDYHSRLTLKMDGIEDAETYNKIMKIIDDQPRCRNCSNYYIVGGYSNYDEHKCKIGHDLEAINSAYRGIDGRKCKDYNRKDETNGTN